MRCSVQNCLNDTKHTTKSHGITFHLFPKELNWRKAWVEALGLSDWEPKDRSTICSEHFDNEDFYITKCGLRKVKNGAVPVNTQCIKFFEKQELRRCKLQEELTARDLIREGLNFSIKYLKVEGSTINPPNRYQDIEEDLNAPATSRVCRICLGMNTKIYDIREYKLDYVFEQVTGIFLHEDDKLPQKICWECAHRLTVCEQFKSKTLRSHHLLTQMLDNKHYISIRDIKSINRVHNRLRTELVSRYFEPNDYYMLVKDDQVTIKTEEPLEIQDEFKEESIENELHEGVNLKVEEVNNEIYLDEFVDGFDDSEDDKKLSEVIPKPKAKVKKKKRLKNKVRVPKVKTVKAVKIKDVDDNPSSTMDKYKNSDVKRRKTQDALDESLFTISNLSYDEQIAEIQKRQENTKYVNAPFKCTICFRGFLTKDRYDAHIIRHSDQSGAYECFICKTRLKTGRALRKHLTAQHTEKFSCKGCPFVTRNRGVAREHEKWHAGTKYQCPHCPSEFDKLTTYLGHIRIKHVSDFVCELCGYTFVSEKGIEVHKKKKHRLDNKTIPVEGPYCEVCDVRFVSEEAHSRHLKLSSRHSSDDDPNRIRNDSQSMNSDKNGRIPRRVERRPVIHPRDPNDRDHRSDNTGPVPCEQCGIQLRDLRLYAQHFRRAHPDKNRTKYPAMKTPCMCEQCGRIFQSMALLKDHMWVHTGEKRFKCDRCEKSFTQKTNLVFHMRVHSATRPSYECPLCGKHFAFFNNRRRHMFIHTGLKPFKCDTCGKSFTTAGEQRAHVEHVHMKKPWPKRVRSQRPNMPHQPDLRELNGDLWKKCTMEQMED